MVSHCNQDLREAMLWAGCLAEAADGGSVATPAARVIGLALVRRLAWKLERRAALVPRVLRLAEPGPTGDEASGETAMSEYLFLLLATALVNNVVLVKFLGPCPTMGVSDDGRVEECGRRARHGRRVDFRHHTCRRRGAIY